MSNDHPPSAPPIPPYGTPDGPPAGPGPVPPRRQYRYATDDFFNWIRGTRLTRVQEGRWAAGVAGGVSRRWDIDPVLVRGVFVAATLFGGVGIVAYGLAWLLLPQDTDGRIHLQRALHGDISLGFVGSLLLTLVGISGGGGGPWGHVWWGWGFPGGLILTLVVVVGIYWFAKRHGPPGPTASSPMPPVATPETPADTAPGDVSDAPSTSAQDAPGHPWSGAVPPGYNGPHYGGPGYGYQPPKPRKRDLSAPSRRLVFSTLGLALLAAAAILLAGHGRHWATPSGLTAAAVALLVIAIGVLASGFLGRRAAGLAGIGLILAIGTVAGVGAHHSGVRSGQNNAIAGEQEWRPATPAAAEKEFNMGFGQETLWLTNPAITATATAAYPLRTQARLAAGHLIVVLPDDTPAEVRVEVAAGQITNPDGQSLQVKNDHQHHQETIRTGSDASAAPLIVLEVDQGFGQLDVRTASQQARLTAPVPTTSVTPSTAPPVPAAK